MCASPTAKDDFSTLFKSYLIDIENEWLGFDPLDSYASKILDAKYEKKSGGRAAQSYLTPSQRNNLAKLLKKHEELFSGKLGMYPHTKCIIELLPGSQAVHVRHYPVPRIHQDTFKQELEHLVKLGVLSYQGSSEWASPSFIIPKNDNQVRWISDLRALNTCIKRKQYPLPIIQDISRKREGCDFFTKRDISMQYYAF